MEKNIGECRGEIIKQRETYNSYHIPGCSNIQKRKINAIFFNPTNTWEHEREKARVCYDLLKEGKKFVTEAARNRNTNGIHRRIDVVCLDGTEYECVHKHESDKDIKIYREEGIIPVIVNPMTCDICHLVYPKRNKINICQNCKNEKKIQ
jgi:hypothetical protein